jgi:hypothetical protein
MEPDVMVDPAIVCDFAGWHVEQADVTAACPVPGPHEPVP